MTAPPDDAVLQRRYGHLEALVGFLDADAFRLFCMLGSLSPSEAAPVLEVGVFCGRSLAGLALAFPDAPAVGVDPMFEAFDNEHALEGEGAFLTRAAGGATPEERLATLRRVLEALSADGDAGLSERVTVERVTQAQFLADPTDDAVFQAVHLDGEHTYAAVEEAMNHLPVLLIEGGWLIMDDFSNPGFPEIAEAIHRHPSFRNELIPAVYGFNKGVFLYRPDAPRLRTVLDALEAWCRKAGYLVRLLADGSMVVHPQMEPGPRPRLTLRQRFAKKLRRLADRIGP